MKSLIDHVFVSLTSPQLKSFSIDNTLLYVEFREEGGYSEEIDLWRGRDEEGSNENVN